MEFIAAAGPGESDESGDGFASVLFLKSAFSPFGRVLPFQRDARGKPKCAVFVIQVAPGFLDRFWVFAAMKGLEFAALLAVALVLTIRFGRRGRFAAGVSDAIESGLRATATDRKVHRPVHFVDHNVGKSERLASDEF